MGWISRTLGVVKRKPHVRPGASVYERSGSLLICASSATANDGANTQDAPFIRLSSDAPDEDVGAAVEEALRGSRAGIPMDGAGYARLLELAGVSSHSTFIRRTKLVSVGVVGDRVTVTPTRRERGSFSYLAPMAELVPRQNLAAIGRLVRDALAEST